MRSGFEGNMINLDKHIVQIKCPRCAFTNPVSIKQIRLGDVTICRGCKANIRLQDHMNTTKKAVRSINRAMAELQEQLGKLGTIKIKL